MTKSMMDNETTTTQHSSPEMTTVGRLLAEFRYGVADKQSTPIPYMPPWLIDTVAATEDLIAKARMRYAINPTKEELEWGKALRRHLDQLLEMMK